MKALGVEITVSIEAIPPVIQHPRGILETFFLAVLLRGFRPVGILLTEHHRQRCAVGRPFEARERSLRKIRQRYRLAARCGHGENLRSGFYATADKGDGRTIRRKTTMTVLARAGELLRFDLVARFNHPEIRRIFILFPGVLASEEDPRTIRGDLRVAEKNELLQVFRGEGALVGSSGGALRDLLFGCGHWFSHRGAIGHLACTDSHSHGSYGCVSLHSKDAQSVCFVYRPVMSIRVPS